MHGSQRERIELIEMERRFGASRCLLALVCVMSLKLGNVSAITIEDLFPLKDGETILKRGDNAESGLIVLDPPFPLLGVNHTNISVSILVFAIAKELL